MQEVRVRTSQVSQVSKDDDFAEDADGDGRGSIGPTAPPRHRVRSRPSGMWNDGVNQLPRSAELPGIDEFDARFLEVGGVAGGQDGAQVAADGCDLSVGDADWPADSLAAGDNVRIRLGGALIKGKDPAVEVFGQDAADHYCQPPLAVTVWEPRNAVPQLGGSHRGRGHVGGFERVKPGEHSGVRHLAGQFGDDVGIEDDHRSNSAGRGRSPLRSGSSRSPSSPWKRARMRLPRLRSPPLGISRSWRMARTSASMDRPCRAASTRSRACVTGSSPRIVSVAIAPLSVPIDCNASNAANDCAILSYFEHAVMGTRSDRHPARYAPYPLFPRKHLSWLAAAL